MNTDQANVVAHAKNCSKVTMDSAEHVTYTEDPFGEIEEIVEEGVRLKRLPSDTEDAAVLEELIPIEEERRGRGLPLWSHPKILILLAGTLKYVDMFSQNIPQTRKAWKYVGCYVRQVSGYHYLLVLSHKHRLGYKKKISNIFI